MPKNMDAKQKLEADLATAVSAIERPSSTRIGLVTVYPDYQASFDDGDLTAFVNQLAKCLGEQVPEGAALKSPQGVQVNVSGDYPLVKKYLKDVTLYADRRIGAWVQVLPPGDVL